MKIKPILIAAVSTIAPFLALLPPVTSVATAQSRSLCSAIISGQEQGSRVNMRSGPGTDFDNPAFVLVGQRVTLLTNDPRDSRSPITPIIRKDNQDMNWYLVEYIPSETRGWIRADFISSINCR